MIYLYRFITWCAYPFLLLLLWRRTIKGKEIKSRLSERQGFSDIARPTDHKLIWLHAASVGEAQSALILIHQISEQYPNISFLVTTGTVTSATLMAKRLPQNAHHQFYPLDHPRWVKRFLDHWRPDLVLWMESELWPNMLLDIKRRHIPAILLNARLSNQSYARWSKLKETSSHMLETFSLILTQTQEDAHRFKSLSNQNPNSKNIITTDNIKYSAAPLPCDPISLESLENTIGKRPMWLFASTHDGEEEMACRIHLKLKEMFPDILTIIVPRHPDRRTDIKQHLSSMGVTVLLRGEKYTLPETGCDIYIADTLGELGLFYRLSPIAVIGRSFSNDGGGGHNPIEAAQLDCAVLTGPYVQFQQDIFNGMIEANAAKQVTNEKELVKELTLLLQSKNELNERSEIAKKFAKKKSYVIDTLMKQLTPFLKEQN